MRALAAPSNLGRRDYDAIMMGPRRNREEIHALEDLRGLRSGMGVKVHDFRY